MKSAGRPPKKDRSTVAESTVALRLTADDRARLNELVRLRAIELANEGVGVTAASYVRGLIRREADAKGIPADFGTPAAASKKTEKRATKK